MLPKRSSLIMINTATCFPADGLHRSLHELAPLNVFVWQTKLMCVGSLCLVDMSPDWPLFYHLISDLNWFKLN